MVDFTIITEAQHMPELSIWNQGSTPRHSSMLVASQLEVSLIHNYTRLDTGPLRRRWTSSVERLQTGRSMDRHTKKD